MIAIHHPQGMRWNAVDERHPSVRIYDVFRTPDDKRIVAIFTTPHQPDATGPAGIEAFCCGHRVRHRCRELRYRLCLNSGKAVRLNLLEIKTPPQMVNRHDAITVELRQAAFRYHVGVQPNPFSCLKKPVKLTLVTVQKNNQVQHIKDWCLYYHRVHHVQHIVLYDNGSNNLETLACELQHLSPALNIRIIAWDFPFLTANCRVAKSAALNHCYHALGNRTAYHMCFDIDEYLVNPNPQLLFDYLNSRPKAMMCDFKVGGKWAPTVYAHGTRVANSTQNRVFHFPYIYKEQNHVIMKTIYRYQEELKISIHHHGNFLPAGLCRIKNSLVTRVTVLIRKFLLHAVKIENRPRLYRMYQKHIGEALYYNHYQGLACPWGRKTVPPVESYPENLWMIPRQKRLIPQEYNPDLHQYDTVMAVILKKAGLANKSKQ